MHLSPTCNSVPKFHTMFFNNKVYLQICYLHNNSSLIRRLLLPSSTWEQKKTKTLSINKLFSDILQKIQKALTALLVLLQSLHALVSVEQVVHWMVGQSSSFIKETETRKIPLTKTMLVTYTENIYVICKCNTKSQVSILERGKT